MEQVVVAQPAKEEVRLQEDTTVDRAGTDKNASLSHNSRKRNNSLTRENDDNCSGDEHYFPPPKKFEVVAVDKVHDWDLSEDMREYVLKTILHIHS